MITMQEAFIKNNAIVKVGDVFVYDATVDDNGKVTNKYIVTLRAPADLKRSSMVFGVRLFREKPCTDGKTICLDNGNLCCRYIGCDEVVSVESHRLGVHVGRVSEDCLNAIFELLSL